MSKKRLSLSTVFLIICTLFFAISLLLYVVSLSSYAAADAIDHTVSRSLRDVLARLSAPFPFSVGEAVLVLLPLLTVGILWRLFRRFDDRRVRRGVLGTVLGVTLAVFSLFLLVLGVSYQTTPLEEKLALSAEPVSAEELQTTARILLSMAERELDAITFLEDGSSVMPYDLDTLSAHLAAAYDALAEDHSFVVAADARVKGITLSVPMSYMQILGVYFFFTGECNINMDYPDVERPFTAAHELAHRRGVGREDEAGMMAFLAGMRADDPYVRYSCTLTVYRYVASALYRADRERYYAVCAEMDDRIRAELAALSRHQRKYSGNLLGEVSSELNDAYLKANGTEGAVSYGLIVDLAVAYLAASEP